MVGRVSLVDLGSKGIPAPITITTHATKGAFFAAVVSTSINEYALVASGDALGSGPWLPLENARGAQVRHQLRKPLAIHVSTDAAPRCMTVQSQMDRARLLHPEMC